MNPSWLNVLTRPSRHMPVRQAIRGVLRLTLFASLPALLSGCALTGGFLDPAGPVTAAQAAHFRAISLIMLLVVLPLFLALPVILWRYRRGGGGGYHPEWEFNRLLEWLVWGVPVLIVVALGWKLLTHTVQYDPYDPLGPEPVRVEVVSLDWKFLFLYPDQGIATVNLLALPADHAVTLKLTSGTVMQSFIVNRLVGQIYTMAGMQTQLNFVTGDPGDFTGRNTQYNGNGFAGQQFETKVMTADDFNAWLTQVKASGQALDWAGYEVLLKPSEHPDPLLYGTVTPGLFDQVIASFAPAEMHDHKEVKE